MALGLRRTGRSRTYRAWCCSFVCRRYGLRCAQMPTRDQIGFPPPQLPLGGDLRFAAPFRKRPASEWLSIATFLGSVPTHCLVGTERDGLSGIGLLAGEVPHGRCDRLLARRRAGPSKAMLAKPEAVRLA